VLGRDTPAARDAALERVHEMLAIIERLQVINRSLLNRLRPMALGHIPLRDLLGQLVRDRAREHPQIAFSFSASELARGYGDSIDLTIYRCIQEGLTNAIRHAQPTSIAVTVTEGRLADAAAQRIELTVTDDGRGMDADAPAGFGLAGMRERVQAVGGELAIGPGLAGGTAVRVAIPVERHTSICVDVADAPGTAP
jgi:two-component system sensor histidine kinase UhpB